MKTNNPASIAAVRLDRPVAARGDGLGNLAPLPAIMIAAASTIPGYLLQTKLPDLVIAGGATLSIYMVLSAIGQGGSLRRWRTSGFWMAALVFAYLFVTLVNQEFADGLKIILQVVLAFGCFLVGLVSAHRARLHPMIDVAVLWSTNALSVLLLTMLLLRGSSLDAEMPKNAVGGVIFYLMVLGVTSRAALTGKASSLRWLAPMMLIDGAVSGQRLILVLAPVAFLTLQRTESARSRTIQRGLLLTAVIISFSSVWLYTNYQGISDFTQWNIFAQNLTGRQITSGRQLIWGPVLNVVEKHPYLGAGLATVASDITGLNFSTHNAFLMVLLQVGLLGLVPLVMLLLTLGWSGTRGARSVWKGYFALILAFVIIHNTYETALIQNNFPIASLLWLSLGFIGGRFDNQSVLPQRRVAKVRALSVHPGS